MRKQILILGFSWVALTGFTNFAQAGCIVEPDSCPQNQKHHGGHPLNFQYSIPAVLERFTPSQPQTSSPHVSAAPRKLPLSLEKK